MLIAGAGYPGQVMVCRYGGKGWPIDPPAPTYTMDLRGASVLPAGWTFSRGGTAGSTDASYYDDVSRTVTDFPTINTPRFRAEGLVIEPSKTNYAPNSFTPGAVAVSSFSLTARNYQMYMKGSGSVTLTNGTATCAAFPIVVTEASPAIFATVGTGTITLTPSGTVNRWQLEPATVTALPGPVAQPGTFIRTTNAAVTRSSEALYYPSCPFLNPNAHACVVEAMVWNYWEGLSFAVFTQSTAANNQEKDTSFSFSNVTIPPGVRLSTTSALATGGGGYIGPALNLDPPHAYNTTYRIGFSASPTRRILCKDGAGNQFSGIASASDVYARPPALDTFGFGAQPAAPPAPTSMIIQRVWYWNKELTENQLAAVCKYGWPLP